MRTTTIKHSCPNCKVRLETLEALAGRSFDCPNCDGNLTVPTQQALMTMARPVIVPEVIPAEGELDLTGYAHRHDSDKPVEVRLGRLAAFKADVDRPTRNAMATTFLGAILVALGAILFSMFGGKSKS